MRTQIQYIYCMMVFFAGGSELRQRHQATSSSTQTQDQAGESNFEDGSAPPAREKSVTELPIFQENGQPATESTEIPASTDTTADNMNSDASMNESQHQISSGSKNQAQVAKAEGKIRKIATRSMSGALMIGLFLGLVYMGHLYVSALVAMVEVLLVRNWH